MSGSRPSGRVVAELGRPETPEETAERKARDRATRRSRQTTRNFVGAVIACVVFVVLLVPFLPLGGAPDQRHTDVDVAAIADDAGDSAGVPLVAPDVPASWQANAAELRGRGTGSTWYIGYVHDGGFAGVNEGLTGDDGWLDEALDGARTTGTATIDGRTWQVYDRTDQGDDAGNVAYGLSTTIDGIPFAVYGTVPPAQVRALAAAVARDAVAKGVARQDGSP